MSLIGAQSAAQIVHDLRAVALAKHILGAEPCKILSAGKTAQIAAYVCKNEKAKNFQLKAKSRRSRGFSAAARECRVQQWLARIQTNRVNPQKGSEAGGEGGAAYAASIDVGAAHAALIDVGAAHAASFDISAAHAVSFDVFATRAEAILVKVIELPLNIPTLCMLLIKVVEVI